MDSNGIGYTVEGYEAPGVRYAHKRLMDAMTSLCAVSPAPRAGATPQPFRPIASNNLLLPLDIRFSTLLSRSPLRAVTPLNGVTVSPVGAERARVVLPFTCTLCYH